MSYPPSYPQYPHAHQLQHQHLRSPTPVVQPHPFEPQLAQQQQQQQLQYPPNGHVHVDEVHQQQQHQQQPPQHQILPPATPTNGNGTEGQKGNRLRKACDSCSIRKVKCDESGPPCRACAALDIPCTFERPSRRRGPPNRHAEAIKKRRLESPGGGGGFSSPTSPNNVAATLASFSSHAVLNAESICPFSTLELLVDDFFIYIHPLCPFPHEPSFRAAFKHREDLNNPSFLALLASMVGLLVASFPRKPRVHLKAQHREHLFPNSMSLVERCHKVAVEARGAGYLDKDLSIYDAVTSYFLGLVGAYTFQWKQTRLYFGETLTITRVLGAHRTKETGFLNVGSLPAIYGSDSSGFEPAAPAIDIIRQEIGRRVFWVMFVGIRSMQQLGASFGELLIPPPTASDPYPPLPMEIDDEYIYPSHYDPQPPGVISRLTGFNINIKIYATVTPLATMELAYGIDSVFDWKRQKRVLEQCLQSCKTSLDQAPPELMLQVSKPFENQAPAQGQYYPPMPEFPGHRVADPNENPQWQLNNPDTRRQLQLEIQKANIYASQLGTRSYIVEKYWNLHESHEAMLANSGGEASAVMSSPGVVASGLDGVLLPKNEGNMRQEGNIEAHIASERENIVKDLLKVLGSISQVNMEPNGGSFINKIRQIASTLIETPQSRKGPVAVKSEEYLGRFLDVLMKLERISPGGRDTSADGVVDEEEELRNWADLREYQMRFATAGGFMSEI